MRHRSEWFLSDPTGLVTVKCRPSSMVMPVMSPSSLEPPSSPNPMSGKVFILGFNSDLKTSKMFLEGVFLEGTSLE